MHCHPLLLALCLGFIAFQDKDIKEPELLKELEVREKEDQAARFAFLGFLEKHKLQGAEGQLGLAKDPKLAEEMSALAHRIEAVDAKNRAWMKVVVAKHGWPGKSLIGKNGARIAWLLVQHADADRAFQRQCLALMSALPKEEVERQHIAYLTDRLLVADKKPQRFGTQLTTNVLGEQVPFPIEDEPNVDKRRAEYGMPPLAEYMKQARSMVEKSAEKGKP